MGRPLGSKNKQKCCTTLSHCLTTQVEAQDEEHLERENQNVLAVINTQLSTTNTSGRIKNQIGAYIKILISTNLL